MSPSRSSCDNCGQPLNPPPDWGEAERVAEFRETFALPVPEGQARAMLCDDCWPRFLAWMRREHPEALRDP